MTLFRQMAILTSLFLLLILATVMALNFHNANQSVQKQLYEDAKNTATSLSLSLGTADGDSSVMATMINANFDSGHYRVIALYDIEDALIYERRVEEKSPDVPQWFIDLVPIKTPVASAQVSAGWSPIGILEVQSDDSHAYHLLYATMTELLFSFVLFAFGGIAILYLLLHIILKPLGRLQEQAEAIINNEFIYQEDLPKTRELRDVVIAMNATVDKVKDMFEKGNQTMQRNHELLYLDPVTKLYNRRYFTLKLPDLLAYENERDGGIFLLIALHGADVANRVLGRGGTDELFGAFGKILHKYGSEYPDRLSARVQGTEFALLLPNCAEACGVQIAESIMAETEALLKLYRLEEEPCYLTVGLYDYQNSQETKEILARADYALSQANLAGEAKLFLHRKNVADNIFGKEAWRSIIEDAIANDHFRLDFWPVVDTRERETKGRVMTFALTGENDEHYSYGSFIASAIGLGLVSPIYRFVLEKLFVQPHEELKETVCSVRLSASYLRNSECLDELRTLFERHGRHLGFKLAFELPDALVLQHFELIRSFAALCRAYGFSVGINQFTGESKDYGYLKSLNPAFIKAESAFFLDQGEDNIHALHLMTDAIGIELIATGVRDAEELEALQRLHIHTIQGPLAESL